MQAFYENSLEKIFCRNDSCVPLSCAAHLHYSVEIAIIYEGKIEVKVDNNALCDARKGDLIVIFPNQVHSFDTKEKDLHILFLIDPSLFPEYSSVFSDYLPESNIVKGALKDGALNSLVKNICKAYEDTDNKYRSAILKGYFLAFLGKLFELTPLKKSDANDGIQAISYVMNYCSANYQKNLSLKMLEQELHMNKYYISHIINKKLKMNFNDYINSIRISNACRYIDDGKITVSEISALVGFNTVRTFNRAFLKHMGVSPREYKNKDIR